MYIQSKLKENKRLVFNLNLGETGKAHENGASLCESKVINKEGDYADIESLQLFTLGLGIIKTCFRVHNPITDIIKVTGEHVQFLFFFQGKSRIISNSVQSSIVLDEGFMRMSYQKDIQFSIEMLADTEARYLAIIMSKSYFIQLLKNETWSEKDSFFAKVATNCLVDLESEGLLITFQIRRILQDITRNAHQGENKKHYVELKLKELLFELYAQQIRIPLGHIVHEQELYKKINEAKSILTNNFVSPPTVRQLARMVALNELKLKQGFKAVCGSTIHVYIVDLRMKEAYNLLNDENALVNEVSVKIGYRSVSHFISTFKNYYGFTPKQLISKRRIA